MKLNNGNFESSVDGSPDQIGTYTTRNGKITMKATQIHGSMYVPLGVGFESRWYTNSEFLALLKKVDDFGGRKQMITGLSNGTTSNYSVSGNTFTLTIGEGKTLTYTKR